jgi:hypothetical protein
MKIHLNTLATKNYEYLPIDIKETSLYGSRISIYVISAVNSPPDAIGAVKILP